MTEPTDAELEALFVEETGFSIDDFPAAILDFARAVLAKWGTPPAVAGEPVVLYPECNHWGMKSATAPKAGAVPLTDEMASKAGRALSDLYATECGIDKEDNWKIYGSDFIETAKLVLAAAHGIKGGQHGAE